MSRKRNKKKKLSRKQRRKKTFEENARYCVDCKKLLSEDRKIYHLCKSCDDARFQAMMKKRKQEQ